MTNRPRRDLVEQVLATIEVFRRMGWTFVVFLGFLELVALAGAWNHPLKLAVDLAALAVTALFALAIVVLPRLAVRLVERAEQRQLKLEHGRT